MQIYNNIGPEREPCETLTATTKFKNNTQQKRLKHFKNFPITITNEEITLTLWPP